MAQIRAQARHGNVGCSGDTRSVRSLPVRVDELASAHAEGIFVKQTNCYSCNSLLISTPT